MLFSSLMAITLALVGLGAYNHAARLSVVTRYNKRMQQQNSLQQVGASNEGSLDETEREWIKISVLPSHVSGHVGSRLEIACEAIGSPPPSITWLRNGVPVQFEDSENLEENRVPEWVSNTGGALAKIVSRFQLPCITPRDTNAIFTCVASSGLHTTLATSALRILQASEESISEECLGKNTQAPRITVFNPAVLQLIGHDVMLVCAAQGTPRPSVHWINSNGHLALGPRFKILESGALVISRLTWSEMGEYTCIAENSEGQDTANTFLYPLLNEEM